MSTGSASTSNSAPAPARTSNSAPASTSTSAGAPTSNSAPAPAPAGASTSTSTSTSTYTSTSSPSTSSTSTSAGASTSSPSTSSTSTSAGASTSTSTSSTSSTSTSAGASTSSPSTSSTSTSAGASTSTSYTPRATPPATSTSSPSPPSLSTSIKGDYLPNQDQTLDNIDNIDNNQGKFMLTRAPTQGDINRDTSAKDNSISSLSKAKTSSTSLSDPLDSISNERERRMQEYEQLRAQDSRYASQQANQGLRSQTSQMKPSFVTEKDRSYNWSNCEDASCCPPNDGRGLTSSGFRRQRLREEMGFATQMLVIFGVIALSLAGIILYTVSKLYKELRFYLEQRRRQNINKHKIVENSGSKSHIMRDGSNDFEDLSRTEDTSSYAENKNDYKQFQKGIQNSIDNYKDYNKKVKKFFETEKKQSPDVIDTRVLDTKYDDWNDWNVDNDDNKK